MKIIILVLSIIFSTIIKSEVSIIKANKPIVYTEEYYFDKIITIEDAVKYLKKFPNGKYVKALLNKSFFVIKSSTESTSDYTDKKIYGRSKYDELGNVTETQYADDFLIKYTYKYDEMGNQVEKITTTPYTKEIEKFSYDILGKVTTKTFLEVEKDKKYAHYYIREYDFDHNDKQIEVMYAAVLLENFEKENQKIIILTHKETLYEYNDKLLLTKKSLIENKKLVEEVFFYYDEFEKLKEKVTKRKDKIAIKDIYEYDDNGILKKQITKKKSKIVEESFYTSKIKGSLRIEEIFTKESEIKWFKYKFVYDKNNNLIENSEKDSTRKWRKTTYQYDDDENVTQVRNIDSSKAWWIERYKYSTVKLKDIY